MITTRIANIPFLAAISNASSVKWDDPRLRYHFLKRVDDKCRFCFFYAPFYTGTTWTVDWKYFLAKRFAFVRSVSKESELTLRRYSERVTLTFEKQKVPLQLIQVKEPTHCSDRIGNG